KCKCFVVLLSLHGVLLGLLLNDGRTKNVFIFCCCCPCTWYDLYQVRLLVDDRFVRSNVKRKVERILRSRKSGVCGAGLKSLHIVWKACMVNRGYIRRVEESELKLG
ncbi:unnamed protein product, partial [Laminaria digitata]